METKSLTAVMLIMAVFLGSTHSAPLQGQVAPSTDKKGKCYDVEKKSMLREKIVPMRCCNMFRERDTCEKKCQENERCIEACLKKPYKICIRLSKKVE